MGHKGSTYSSTASSILRSYSFFLNIGIIGRQSLLQKRHLGKKRSSHENFKKRFTCVSLVEYSNSASSSIPASLVTTLESNKYVCSSGP